MSSQCQKQIIASGAKDVPAACFKCGSGPCPIIGNNNEATYNVTVIPGPVLNPTFKAGDPQPASPTRVVVCAANKYGDHAMFIGVRHFCPIMIENMAEYDVKVLRKVYGEVQGFIDQFGVFMDREEAYAVASAAGQLNTRRPKTFPEYKLFSEDIY